MLEQGRIEKYAKQLQQEKEFQNQLLRQLTRDIYLQLSQRQEKNLTSLLDEFKAVSYLEKLLINNFQSPTFWEKQANWILSRLDAWNQNNQEPLPLSSSFDLPKKPTKTKQRQSYLLSLCAFNTANEIIQALNVSSLSVEALERLLGLRGDTSPTTEPRLEPLSAIPTSALMASSISAQLRKDLWQQDDNGLAVFHHKCKTTPGNYIEHYITNAGDITLLPWDAAEQIIDKFGFNTVKLQLIFAAHTMKQDEPWRSIFKLKASDIIKELGWDKDHGSNLPEKRNEVASIAHALSSLLVKAVWIEGVNKNKINASTPTGRMWEVLIDPHGQLNILSGKIDEPDEVYLTIRPGLWTENFLNRAGQKAREALYQFGYLALNLLKIDPYHDELALRLAIHLTIDSRIRARDENPYEYKVKSLLDAVLPKTVTQTAREDKYKARNLRNRWNSALKLLMELGWQIQFDESYPEWIRPESNAPKPSDWRRIKIIERMLQAKLTIQPPAPIPAKLAILTERHKPQQLADQKTGLTGEQIQIGREARGWSRKQLASYLDLSENYLGKLERGDRVPTPKLETKLRKLLAISSGNKAS